MARYSVEEINSACGGKIFSEKLLPEGYFIEAGEKTNISTDSRFISNGMVFLALKGERFDGHDFIDKALEKGAALLIISKREALPDIINKAAVILVEDTLKAYQDIAGLHRKHISGSVIAVSGSVGKTSCRDLIYAALGGFGQQNLVFRTTENLNNQIGVPKTLLSCPEDCDALIVEIGLEKPGDMIRLASVCSPDIAYVTNIGYSHLENFGSRNRLAEEKLKLLECVRPGGTAIVRLSDPFQYAYIKNGGEELLTEKNISLMYLFEYGVGNSSQSILSDQALRPVFCGKVVSFSAGKSCFSVDLKGKDKLSFEFSLPQYAPHLLGSALCGLAAAYLKGKSLGSAAEGLSEYKATGARQKIIFGEEVTLIDDSYNASPESVESALKTLSFLKSENGGRAVAVLASVNELGTEAEKIHMNIGKMLYDSAADMVFLLGKYAPFVREGIRKAAEKAKKAPGFRLLCFSSLDELIPSLLSKIKEDDIILVKGSHSYKMWLAGKAVLEKTEKTKSEVSS